MLRKMPRTDKCVFSELKNQPQVPKVQSGSVALQAGFCLGSVGEETPKLLFLATLTQEDWCVCAHLSVVITLLHSGGEADMHLWRNMSAKGQP